MKVLTGLRLVILLLWVGLDALGAPSPTPSPTQNPFLTPKLEEIIKTAMKVIREDEGVVYLTLPGNHSLAEKTPILFFRKKASRLEMIATGKVLNEAPDPKSGQIQIQVELDRDTVIKYPVEGDYAAPLSDPSLLANGAKRDQNDFLLPEEDSRNQVNDRPGYVEVGAGILLGDLGSTTSTVANFEKRTSAYRFQNFHWAYFSDFFPVGVTSDSHGGNFPTTTYYSKVVSSDAQVSVLGFHYRFSPIFNDNLEISARVDSLTDRFNTDNSDENLLTTQVQGLGFGVRGRYSFAPLLWKPEKRRTLAMTFQALTLNVTYFPMLTATDIGVSRGTSSSGSSGFNLRVSATMLFWINFIPWFKRWVFEGSYGLRSYDLKFSGPVTLEAVPAPVAIAQGTRATERESDFRFFFGVRIEDPIRSLFSDGKKKK